LRIKHLLIAIPLIFAIFCIDFTSDYLPLVNAVEKIKKIYPIADAYVKAYNPESNYGGNEYLDVSYTPWSYSHNTIENTYLLFDLSNIKITTENITSVDLALYHPILLGPTVYVGVYSCSNTDWNEFEITWSNAPAFSQEPLDVTPVAFADEWYYWNITEEAKSSQPGFLALVLSVADSKNEDVQAQFESNDGYSDHQPHLEIGYISTLETELEPPVASFTYSPVDPQVNQTISFDASGCTDSDGTIVSYSWIFGDGHMSQLQTPTHTYNQEGSYTVMLTVIDNDGLIDTTTVSLDNVVIPEFPSWTIIPLLMIGTLVGLSIRNKIRKNGLE
jgi:hypothetical protein